MFDRRSWLLASSSVAAASLLSFRNVSADQPGHTASSDKKKTNSESPVSFALNTSSVRGQKLSVPEQIQVASDAGYDGIEPWIRDLRTYIDDGGSVAELRTRIEDAGLEVSSAIGFAQWIADDEQQRAAGLDEARNDMELVASIGGTRIAAPPVGAHRSAGPPLPVIAERYRALLEVGSEMGVAPMLELWGFSPTLSRLSELAFVATAAEHPMACVLPDFYHIYKGGSDFAALGMIEASRMPVFHINDYPSDPPRETIADKHRVFPGDGVCPLPEVISMLLEHGFSGTFSLELFNPDYWQRDAAEVASEGLQKSKAVVTAAAQAKRG